MWKKRPINRAYRPIYRPFNTRFLLIIVIVHSSCIKYHKEKALQLLELASTSIGSSNRSLTFVLQQTNRLIVQSYTISAIILAGIGDINNFSSPYKLLAFAGMEPSTYQSGKYNTSYTPMVKCGFAYLRWAIMQAGIWCPKSGQCNFGWIHFLDAD